MDRLVHKYQWGAECPIILRGTVRAAVNLNQESDGFHRHLSKPVPRGQGPLNLTRPTINYGVARLK